MSASVNKAIVVGRAGADPTVRYTSSGQGVANFNLATDEVYKDKSGENQKRTEWHRIVLWGKLAEIAENYVHKGSLLYIEGRLQTRKYEQAGVEKYSTEIVGHTLQLLSPKGDSGSPASGQESDAVEPAEVADDDIPF